MPGWLAVIEQIPTERRVTTFPDTVQTGAVTDAKLTGKPELAVALRGRGAVPNTTLLGRPNVIVCDDARTTSD